MDRNESFDALSTTAITVRLAWASLEIMVDDVPDIQLLICGGEEDVSAVKAACEDGRLLVEQPAAGLTLRLNEPHWMEVLLRIPRAWKGAVTAAATSGALNVRSLSGTDMALETSSGPLRAFDLDALTVSLRTGSADLHAGSVRADKLALRTASGDMLVTGAFRQIRSGSMTGTLTLLADEPFDTLDVNTVSGDVTVTAPIAVADVVMKGRGGKLRTTGVSINEGGPRVTVSSMSANVTIYSTLEENT